MMTLSYRQSCEQYDLETAAMSRFWWLWLPLAIAVSLPIVSVISFPFYKAVFENELFGLLELGAVFLPLAAGILGLRILMDADVRKDRLIMIWLILLALGCIYFAGEEASWGQHHFGWATPESWAEINQQNETNIHNNSVWFNLVPRAVLIIGIVVGGFLAPWVKRNRPDLVARRFDFLYPPLALRWLASIVLGLEVYTQLENNFDLDEYLSFSDGESQELFIAWSLLLYALALYRRWQGWRCHP